ncbi:MAG TPA: TIGR02996 domain-containing protein [bacterium]|nr:TIGR02996 domain-containing protein [bacterium]
MSDRAPIPEPLIAAVRADPEANAPRLAVADWLEGQGRRQRALLVRLQCTHEWNDLTAMEAESRVVESLVASGEACGTPRYERGFATSLFVTWNRVTPEQVAAFARAEPFFGSMLISFLDIKEASDAARGLALRPPAVRELVLCDTMESEVVAADDGASASYACCALARALAAAPPRGVEKLDLMSCGIEGDCVGNVLHAVREARIPTVGLYQARLRVNDGFAALGSAAPLPDLRALSLQETGLDAAAIRAALAGPALRDLLSLSLYQCRELGDRGAAAIAESGRAFETLDLRDCGIGEEGAFALANAPILTDSGRLQVGWNPIGERARKKLSDRFGERVRF